MDIDPEMVAAHPEVAGLSISQQLMQRIERVTDANGNIDPDDAIGPIISAIVALERAWREGP